MVRHRYQDSVYGVNQMLTRLAGCSANRHYLVQMNQFAMMGWQECLIVKELDVRSQIFDNVENARHRAGDGSEC